MSILATTLEIVRERLNAALQNLESQPDPWVALSTMKDADGQPAEGVRNKLVLCLFNLLDEKMMNAGGPMARGPTGEFGAASPPLYLDVNIALIANFHGERYADGLTALSRAISYFQQNPWLNRRMAPQLDPAIEKLTFDFLNLESSELFSVMSALGISYVPTVFYKIRLLPFTSQAMTVRVTPVGGSS